MSTPNNSNKKKTRRRKLLAVISALVVVFLAAALHGTLMFVRTEDAEAVARTSSLLWSWMNVLALPLWVLMDGLQALFGLVNKDESIFQYGEDGLPLCNGCHCTPSWDEDPETFQCPEEDPPPWQYPSEAIETLASQEALNPFSLDCSPYHEASCDTVPSLEREKWAAVAAEQNESSVVCGLLFEEPHPTVVRSWRHHHHRRKQEQGSNSADSDAGDYHPCPLTNYTLRTFASEKEAIKHNAVVTHTNSCGACSTTKDLAAYMKHPDMVAQGRRCTNRIMLFGIPSGVACYEALGFTTACATIWAHNSLNTATVCRYLCTRHLFSPPNQPQPHCRLNECLHCDEVKSGPNFQLFAGRTRRNSGLRTPILRQCEGLAYLEHESCPVDTVLPPASSAAKEDRDLLVQSVQSCEASH